MNIELTLKGSTPMKRILNLPGTLLSVVAIFALAFGMPSVASASKTGFAVDSGGDIVTHMAGCLHTTRWTSDMGECGKPPVMDSDGDGVTDDKDKCPGTPKGVKVDSVGCPLDSDGDGVPDYLDKCPGTPKGAKVDSRGCEIIGKIVIPGILFAFDKADLKDTAKTKLDDAAAQITANKNVKSVTATGYTDSTGPEAYNQGLSERRANAVKAYLEGKGVSNVTAVGKGEADPVADNSTKEGRAQNRRVEIDVKL
jgi:OOP family OmpA-OmpF porin